MIDYDPETGCDDGYDEALKWCIEQIINEIHRINELDSYLVEEVYYTIFNKDFEEAYLEYIKECQTP